MKLSWNRKKAKLFLQKMTLLVFLMVVLELSTVQGNPSVNVMIWDSCSYLDDMVDIGKKTGWKVVPINLLKLETDPPKASSDPGYYGREYTFEGDAVIESDRLVILFQSKKRSVAFFSKATPDRKIVDFSPFPMKINPAGVVHVGIVQNTGDEATLKISLFNAHDQNLSYILSLDRSGIIGIKPSQYLQRFNLQGKIEYGIVPSFIGDDLIYDPKQYPSMNVLSLPSENLFLGLLQGENSQLVITWPEGRQRIGLRLGGKEQEERFIESIDFETEGQSLYMAILESDGIWHSEKLTSSFLEREVAISWKRPFPAKWITQLYEGEVKTTYGFRDFKGQIWRGVAGMYLYPVWFDGDIAFYHLSKKVPPKGESIIYFLEGNNTPVSIPTPVDIMKATLGRKTCDDLFDLAGQTLRTHHRRGGVGIRRACTCGCTEAIEIVFKAGQENDRSEYIDEAIADMLYFVERHMERIDEYRVFADTMIKFLRSAASSSVELKPFVEPLEQIALQIPQDYDAQRGNIKSIVYAKELASKTGALVHRKSAENLSACLDLCGKWRDMGGAQDSLLAEYHMIVRKLFQEAGYGCVEWPNAVELAQEIRNRCRQCLRNPDGYEIWANY
ncbi:MAG: hypothetical protein JXA82_16765 [Sedimentisphaerales bacterium]|nr:hypothetical protein [Sedimentisphaerales bacterium]